MKQLLNEILENNIKNYKQYIEERNYNDENFQIILNKRFCHYAPCMNKIIGNYNYCHLHNEESL